jgi:hypothetical protein
MTVMRYKRTGNLDDIQKAITFQELGVAATPLNDLNRVSSLGNLSNMLSLRFERTGDLGDLQQAILQY